MRWTFPRLLIVLALLLTLTLSPASAQADSIPDDNPLENAVPITPLGILGMIASSVLGSGGLLWLWSKARIDSDKQRREADLLAIRNTHEEQMTDLKGQLDERKRSDEMMTQLLTLYGRNADTVQQMVTQMASMTTQQERAAELLTSQTSVLLSVGKDVEGTNVSINTVRQIVLDVLDHSKTHTSQGESVMQRLDAVITELGRIASKFKTKELTPQPEQTGVLVTPPPSTSN